MDFNFGTDFSMVINQFKGISVLTGATSGLKAVVKSNSTNNNIEIFTIVRTSVKR